MGRQIRHDVRIGGTVQLFPNEPEAHAHRPKNPWRKIKDERKENDEEREPHIMLMADMTQSFELLWIEMHLFSVLDFNSGRG